MVLQETRGCSLLLTARVCTVILIIWRQPQLEQGQLQRGRFSIYRGLIILVLVKCTLLHILREVRPPVKKPLLKILAHSRRVLNLTEVASHLNHIHRAMLLLEGAMFPLIAQARDLQNIVLLNRKSTQGWVNIARLRAEWAREFIIQKLQVPELLSMTRLIMPFLLWIKWVLSSTQKNPDL